MSKRVLVVLACCGAFLAGGSQGAAAGSDGTTVCDQNTQTFSGTTANLIVPIGGYCAIDHATITENLVVQNGAGTDVTNSTIGYDETLGNDSGATLGNSSVGHDVKVGFNGFFAAGHATIGHDLVATHPDSIQTGSTGPPPDGITGPVTVGHDFMLNGSPGPPNPDDFVFDGLCGLRISNDLSITNRWVTLGIGLGGQCASNGLEPDSVGHDLIVTGNSALTGFFGPSNLAVVGVTVGNDLIVTRNSAAGVVQVAANIVGHDATCLNNNPPASLAGGGENSIGGTSTGCP
jgi:hypothetical protein